MSDLLVGSDGLRRCAWPGDDPLYLSYHDEEWGRPEHDDHRLYEKIVLEGFQAGLSWITVLRKREAFREHFKGFDPVVVAGFDERDIERMLGDARIIRHRGKIESAINNAQRTLDLQAEVGSLAEHLWSFAPKRRRAPRSFADLPAVSDESTALSKDLKKRGFSFVGPTTMYALMQAMGMVDDHLVGCVSRNGGLRPPSRSQGGGLRPPLRSQGVRNVLDS